MRVEFIWKLNKIKRTFYLILGLNEKCQKNLTDP